MASLTSQAKHLEDRPKPSEWQRELSQSVCDPAELCRLVGLPISVAVEAQKASHGFPMLVTRPYLARIRRNDADDPLLLQVLPSQAELHQAAGFTCDPLSENSAQCSPGLLWKYQNRILILTTPACAVHCRFCFRRHFLFDQQPNLQSLWGEAIRFLTTEPTIHEVIFSGGDPLMISDKQLSEVMSSLKLSPSIKRLRIHSRMPIVVPSRICDELISCIKDTQLTTVMVVHVNHPREIDSEVEAAFGRLIEAGIPVLSQGVLLAGVNDNVDVLTELYERLADLRVMPYYLHQLDLVAGASHFEVPITKGKELMAKLRSRLPGYAVPRYVRETVGGTSKEILA